MRVNDNIVSYMKENYAIVLDFLVQGYADSFRNEPVIQAVGEDYLSLLELMPKEGQTVSLRERVYIGLDKRDKIQSIQGRLMYNSLTNTARNELEAVLREIVVKNEAKYVGFFNKTGSISIRMHSLELLPNIGKKHTGDILKERERKPFESFKDMASRIHLMPDPARVIVERIIEELKGGSQYYLFARPSGDPNPRPY